VALPAPPIRLAAARRVAVSTVRGELVALGGGVLSLLVRIVIVGVILLVVIAFALCRV
jgi:high-affinity Fe2+/Pb2+ permease